mmetsp:Transcript_58376/g.125591  ORF Transcript_58376/g.125591 Transcript_58376/m.125591 type:complete len:212 (+) Transcript_58376:2382-3017(+)
MMVRQAGPALQRHVPTSFRTNFLVAHRTNCVPFDLSPVHRVVVNATNHNAITSHHHLHESLQKPEFQVHQYDASQEARSTNTVFEIFDILHFNQLQRSVHGGGRNTDVRDRQQDVAHKLLALVQLQELTLALQLFIQLSRSRIAILLSSQWIRTACHFARHWLQRSCISFSNHRIFRTTAHKARAGPSPQSQSHSHNSHESPQHASNGCEQ